MYDKPSVDWGQSELASLFRSPFLVPSLLVHGALLLIAMRAATLKIPLAETKTPISVQLLEARTGNSDSKSMGPGKGPGGPQHSTKLGVPRAPVQQTGNLKTGSTEASVPSQNTIETAPPPKPVPLPGPKAIAAEKRPPTVNANETSPDSLVRLPTKESPTALASTTTSDLEAQQRSLAALKAAGEGPGIKALKDGSQVPGALKGNGTGSGPYGVSGGSRSGSGIAGGGTGSGIGGGSATGLRGIPAADYNNYLSQLKKRVESVWKHPDGVTGVQKVAIRIALDRAGKLTLSEVLDSSDSRLNTSALEALRRASPFPAMPESLKDLANEPMIIRFEVAIGVPG